MRDGLAGQVERRKKPRFSVRMPLTVFIGDRGVPGYVREVSDQGLYFYLRIPDGEAISQVFEFMMKMPPEITLSAWCSIRGRARVVRKEAARRNVTAIAAEILEYSILRGPGSSAGPAHDDRPASS